jgi:hypothetical protein
MNNAVTSPSCCPVAGPNHTGFGQVDKSQTAARLRQRARVRLKCPSRALKWGFHGPKPGGCELILKQMEMSWMLCCGVPRFHAAPYMDRSRRRESKSTNASDLRRKIDYRDQDALRLQPI